MNSNTMDRKQFLTLTFTLLGGAAAVAGCSSSGSSGGSGGSNGSGGNGSGGSTGANCADPLPETQLTDSTGHVHTLSIPVSDLEKTSDQDIETTMVLDHSHTVTLTVANLAAIRAGGPITVASTVAGSPEHSHMFSVRCTAA